MTKKRIITLTGAAVAGLLVVVSCVALRRDSVSVVDAATREPIAGANVLAVYPSTTSEMLITDKRGMARFGIVGIERNALAIEVTKQGYDKATVYFSNAPPHHVEVVLRESRK